MKVDDKKDETHSTRTLISLFLVLVSLKVEHCSL